jgi:hypothetical protein
MQENTWEKIKKWIRKGDRYMRKKGQTEFYMTAGFSAGLKFQQTTT